MVDDKVLDLAKLFAASSAQCVNLYGFHNQIYLIKGERDFILRIAEPNHRSKAETIGEVDFLLFLKEKGVSLAAPKIGQDGEYVYEITEDNTMWIVSAFEIAKGHDFMTRPADEDEKLREIGRMLGKIHKHAKEYQPPNGLMRRQWHENQHLLKAGELFEQHYPALKLKFDDFISQMKALPKDDSSYGLVHGDYLYSNYFFDEDEITIFDFDECEYSWFIYDIAVCMYYYLLGVDPSTLQKKTEEAESLLFKLLSGYIEENTLDIYWFENIDLFFKMRDYVLLATMSETPYSSFDGWQKTFFDAAMERQLTDKPFIRADFIRVYHSLLA